ncbi:MAG: cellulase family glycosylhydrolase [Candidatus Cryptobacteroides sp.]
MKKLSLLILSAVLSACGCAKPAEQQQSAQAPVLVSVAPENGAGGVAIDGAQNIVFSYDQNIKVHPSFEGSVSLSPSGTIDKVNAYGKDLTVTVSGLQYETKYTISITDGYVKGFRENQDAAKGVSTTFTTVGAPAPPKDIPAPGVGSGGWENNTAAVLNMKYGWNLGNTLDSYNFTYNSSLTWEQMQQESWIWKSTDRSASAWETAWGQPLATRELIRMFKQAGFGVIRVPVTWAEHIDAEGNVDEAWMARVEEVVGYVLDEGLYCILNVHHDTGTQGWLRADEAMYQKYKDVFARLWIQIAERFRDKGEKLLFEGYNEMLNMNAAWSVNGGDAALPVVNKFAQLFVDTVRATGGNNAHRNLIVSTYAGATGAGVLEDFVIPEDSASDHLIAEVHSYAPYCFAFKQDDPKQQITVFDEACEREIQGIMQDIATKLMGKGVPVIVGEYGSDSAVASDTELGKQAACYVSTAKQYGICCIYWMGLSDQKDRAVPTWTKPLVKDAIIAAWNK